MNLSVHWASASSFVVEPPAHAMSASRVGKVAAHIIAPLAVIAFLQFLSCTKDQRGSSSYFDVGTRGHREQASVKICGTSGACASSSPR